MDSLGLVFRCLGALFGIMLVLLRALGRVLVSQNLLGEATAAVFYDVLLHVARVPLRNLFILYISMFSKYLLSLSSSIFLLLEPLGVDFELPNGPPHPQNP